jgi:sialate O-acetylesterase
MTIIFRKFNFSNPFFLSLGLFTVFLFGRSLEMRAEVSLPLVFGDHMVLQQGTTIPVWGWGAPGEKVMVTFGRQKVRTICGADGKWRVDLAPVNFNNKGQVLTVKGQNELTFQDVLVGDVWLASGQSNMEYGINGKKLYAADVDKADDPLLRLFFVPKTTSLNPLKDILPWPLSYAGQSSTTVAKGNPDPYRARWVLCTPEALRKINGQGFATVAYFFAREIRNRTGHPLGVIESSWGGTRAEAWTSLSGLKKDPPFTKYIKVQEKQTADFASLEATYSQRKAEYETALAKWNQEIGKPFDKLHNVWKANLLEARASAQPDPPEPAPASPRPVTVHPPDNDTNTPGNIFNAMISPLIPFAIKGVIWYQGEFNSGFDSGIEYRILFPRLISDWREKWGRGDFPFLFVQIPNLGRIDPQPSVEGGGWRWVRDSQLKALSLPKTAMVVTIDIGDPNELHPPDKLDVALRLSLAARQLVYGKKIVASGPLYDKMKVEGNKVRLSFTNQGSGLTLGVSPYRPLGKEPTATTELKGFGVAGADHIFHWAKAVIEGKTVVVQSDKVPVPVAVRYNFSNSPQGNLYNKEGLPASPFRTDSWDERDK